MFKLNVIGFIFLYIISVQSCVRTPSKLYFERSNDDKVEVLQISTNLDKFYYEANRGNDSYLVAGEVEFESSLYKLIFPLSSQYPELSPIEKATSELIKFNESDSIKLIITQFDLAHQMLAIGRHGLILSKLNNSEIQRFNTNILTLPKEFEGEIMKFGGLLYGELLVDIPEQGEYYLRVELQENYSNISYAMTSNGCFASYTYPNKYLRVCEELNSVPLKVDFSRDCKNPFELKKTNSLFRSRSKN